MWAVWNVGGTPLHSWPHVALTAEGETDWGYGYILLFSKGIHDGNSHDDGSHPGNHPGILGGNYGTHSLHTHLRGSASPVTAEWPFPVSGVASNQLNRTQSPWTTLGKDTRILHFHLFQLEAWRSTQGSLENSSGCLSPNGLAHLLAQQQSSLE